MKKIKNIIIANDTEAFAGIICTIKNSKKRAEKIVQEDFLCGRFLFWENDNKVVITPRPIQMEIIEQIRFLGQKNVENWFPKKVLTNLSQAIYEDKVLFKKLKETIQQNPGVILSPYCYTFEFSQLLNKLRGIRLRFQVDQLPKDRMSSLVEYLGSKVGFRNELQKIWGEVSFIPQSKFFIHKNQKEVCAGVAWFYERGMPCVVKANSGEGGWGVLFVLPRKFDTINELNTWLHEEFKLDSIWYRGPYVVEEFIISDNSPERSPSLEVFVGKKKHTITYTCNQMIDRQGRFIGVLMGKNCIKVDMERRIRKIGRAIAERYANLGYRGFFDVDFVTSLIGQPYPIETNVRRTGGTHVFDFVRWEFGSNWDKKIAVLSSDSFEYGTKVLSAKKMLHEIESVRFPMNNKKEGVIIAALSGDKPVFSCIIVGSNKKRTFEIYKTLREIFSH